MKKIIIPLELHNIEEERRTILYGAKLARDIGMGIVLTYNYTTGQDRTTTSGISMVGDHPVHHSAVLLKERDELIKKMLQAYQRELSQLKEAPPSTEIHILLNQYADHPANKDGENGAAFVLLPRKTILSSPIIPGSRVNTVDYEYGNTPILLHPMDSKYLPIRKIIYGTNCNSCDLGLLKQLTDIFGKENIEIEFLHITDDLDFEAHIKQTGYLQVVRRKTGNSNINNSTLVLRDKTEAANSLRSYAFERDANMITVLMEKKDLIEKMLQPGTVYNVVAESNLPVMIFRV